MESPSSQAFEHQLRLKLGRLKSVYTSYGPPFFISDIYYLGKWPLVGLSSSTQLRPACRAQRSSSTGGEPCPRPASAILTIGKGEPADFRAHISARRHLATSACGLGAALLRRQSSLL